MANSESTAHSEKPWRGCLACLTTALALGIAVPFGIRSLRQQSRLDMERAQTEWRQERFNDVQNGRRAVVVSDTRLLPMLAGDGDCVANLVDVTFSMVEISPEDAKHVSRLANLRSIGFYCTRGAEQVLEHARDLPIEKLFFEATRVPDDALRMLSQFPRLKRVHFEQPMFPDEIAILRSLPPEITVEIPFPDEGEPSHIGQDIGAQK